MNKELEANITLSHYRVLRKLGAGGMGEVYLAEDTRLDRKVAVKLLPADFAKDAERVRRFEQEARATSALNHPNILTVYDIGTQDGSPFIVAELLEGEELREQLNGDPLPVRRAIGYAQQIAAGLAAAHEKGIVHRDLKPENLFVTSDGRVKILDFGIAKLAAARASTSPDISEDATRKILTNPGVVMGTAGYMSPEQVRGQNVDHRSDIFSFGLILYEMLSGRRAFQGGSLAETMAAIVKEDPPDLIEANPKVPAQLEHLVRRCLEKKPEQRFQTASDLGFALESLATASGVSKAEAVVEPAPAKRSRWPWLLGLGFALLAFGVAGIFVGQAIWKTPLPNYQQLTFRRGTVYNARFAPDGQTIVFSAAWNGNPLEIFSTRAGLSEARSLGLPPADLLAVSSTGELAVLINRRFLGQLSSRGTLARLPMIGGAAREILEDVQEADWSPDGENLAVVRYVNGRNRLEYPIGKVLYETAGYISHPRVSPRGDRVGFMDHQIQWDNRGWVAVVDLNGNKKVLSTEASAEEGLAWSSTGDEIWFTADLLGGGLLTLHAVTPAGRERVVERVPADLMLHDIARDGRLLLTRLKQQTDVIGLPPGETKDRDLSWLDNGEVTDLSADGKTFVFAYWGQGSGTNYAVYLGKMDGSPAVRLGEGYPLSISPDGKWVLTVHFVPPQLVLLPTGAGEIKRLERYGIGLYGAAKWLPDGKQVLFTGREAGHGMRCYVQEIETGKPRPITPEGVVGRLISPDGKFLVAFDAQRKGTLYPIEGEGSARPIPGLDERDELASWSGDGRSLYVYRPTELPMSISRLDLATGRKELWKEVTPADRAGIYWPPQLLLTPDGKWYIYHARRYLTDLYLVEGLK